MDGGFWRAARAGGAAGMGLACHAAESAVPGPAVGRAAAHTRETTGR